MGMRDSQAPINSKLGQDVYDCIDSLSDFFIQSGIEPIVGFNSMLALIVARFQVWNTSEEEFIESMRKAWDHYSKGSV